MPEKQLLTTGEIAKHCGVSFRTVIRWIQKGYLKGFQLPGRGDNRVAVDDFLEFLKTHRINIPVSFDKSAHPPQILIVDDELPMARSIQRILSQAGYETLIATDGFKAGVLIGDLAPDLLTLDLSMPGISGCDVIRFVRSTKNHAHTKILVVSALPREELDVALKAGADDTLSKPFQPEELLQRIRELLGQHQLGYAESV